MQVISLLEIKWPFILLNCKLETRQMKTDAGLRNYCWFHMTLSKFELKNYNLSFEVLLSEQFLNSHFPSTLHVKKSHRLDYERGCLHIYLLSFPSC